MLVDLHTHSTFSDGLVSVRQLVKKAKQRGVKLLALTDHDTISGWSVFEKECARHGVIGVRGLELSTDLDDLEMHIVGYEPARNHEPLIRHLQLQQEKRVARAKLVIAKLQHLGLYFQKGAVRHLLRQPTVGKPQLGRAILREKHNRLLLKELFNFDGSLSDFIGKFLDQPGQIGYVHKKRIGSIEAIHLLRRCGGKAALAHPDIELPEPRLAERVIGRLARAGLWGMEMPHHHPWRKKYLLPLARKCNLTITYGSDTHDGKRIGVAISGMEYVKVYEGLFGHC